MTSKMKGKPIIYITTETKSKLNDLVWKHRFETYEEAVVWLLEHQK